MKVLLFIIFFVALGNTSFAEESYLDLISITEKKILSVYGKDSIASEVALEKLKVIIKSKDTEKQKKDKIKSLLNKISDVAPSDSEHSPSKLKVESLSEDLERRYIDCLNILFTGFYILKESKDFNFVEKSIFNNIDFSKVPKDLEPYFKRLIDVCSQASVAQRAKVGTESYYTDALAKKVMSNISRFLIGTMDPSTAIFSSLKSAYDFDEKKNAQIHNIYLQYEQRLKSDEYDLIKEADRIKSRLNIGKNLVLSPEHIKEFSKISLIKSNEDKLNLTKSYAEKYPDFIPVHGAIIEIICGDSKLWRDFKLIDKSFSKIHKNPNTIYKIDPTFIKSSTSIGNLLMMIIFANKMDKEAASKGLLNFSKISINRYKNVPEFYLYRGVGTLLGSGVSDECWKDLTIRSEGTSSPTINNLRNFWQCLSLGSNDNFMTNEDFKKSCKTIFNDGLKNVEFLINQKKVNFDKVRGAIFEELSALKLSCHFKTGLVFTDLVVVNNSEYPVYNVTVKGTYLRKGVIKNVNHIISKIEAGKSASIKKLGLKAGLDENTEKIVLNAEY